LGLSHDFKGGLMWNSQLEYFGAPQELIGGVCLGDVFQGVFTKGFQKGLGTRTNF